MKTEPDPILESFIAHFGKIAFYAPTIGVFSERCFGIGWRQKVSMQEADNKLRSFLLDIEKMYGYKFSTLEAMWHVAGAHYATRVYKQSEVPDEQ